MNFLASQIWQHFHMFTLVWLAWFITSRPWPHKKLLDYATKQIARAKSSSISWPTTKIIPNKQLSQLLSNSKRENQHSLLTFSLSHISPLTPHHSHLPSLSPQIFSLLNPHSLTSHASPAPLTAFETVAFFTRSLSPSLTLSLVLICRRIARPVSLTPAVPAFLSGACLLKWVSPPASMRAN